MQNTIQKIEELNWKIAAQELNDNGFTLIENVVSDMECEELIRNYSKPELYRKTINMERYRFGSGEYKYLSYPLPDLIRIIRTTVYSKIVSVANLWMDVLKINQHYPETFSDFQSICHASNQAKPTVLILKYGVGGHNTLHQDLYGDIYFPIQLVLFLSEPEKDYIGGEFVLTQQTPRAQSKAIVLKPSKGAMLLFTTNFRPVKGSKGYYRANMKHGVSEIKKGSRYTLGIIFHDAQS